MSLSDKIKATAEDTVGKVKEVVGDLTNKDDVKAEGQHDQINADVKKAGEHLEGKPPV